MPSVSLADIIVQITARNDLLRQQLLQAEGMVKASADRMGRTSSLGGFGGKLPLSSFIGRASAIGFGAASIPAAINQQEAWFDTVRAGVAFLQGDMTKFRAAAEVARASWERFVTSLPIIGPLLDNIGDTLANTINRLRGLTGREERALERQAQAEIQIERIRRAAGSDPTTFGVKTALGVAQIGTNQIQSQRDSIGRQTETLTSINNKIQSIMRTLENFQITVSQ